MKRFVLTIALVFALGGSGTVPAAVLLEAAKSCDEARKTLAELVKKPNSRDVPLIVDALGVDTLTSCDSPEGEIICFQCLDRAGELRSVQLLRRKATGRFDLIEGFGCRCRDKQ